MRTGAMTNTRLVKTNKTHTTMGWITDIRLITAGPDLYYATWTDGRTSSLTVQDVHIGIILHKAVADFGAAELVTGFTNINGRPPKTPHDTLIPARVKSQSNAVLHALWSTDASD